MRLLHVANMPFLPATAGNRRRCDVLLAWLAAHGVEVGSVLLPDGERAGWDVDGMRRRLAFLEIADDVARPDALPAGPVASRLARLRDRLPHTVDAWCPPAFRTRVADVAARWRPDVVLVHYVYLSACFAALPPDLRALRVLDTQDLMHRRRAALAAAGLSPRWFHTTRRQEAMALRRADVVLAIQDDDAAALRTLAPGVEVLTVPHAEPVAAAAPADALPGRVLVVASHNALNVVGLRTFLAAAWPALRARVPGATLHVCGTVAAAVGDVPAGVVLRGVVPDLAAEYAAARAVVAPVPSGTGLKVKVVEALSHGRPVVATPAAADGIATGAGTGVVVARDAPTTADALARLLGDDAAWRAAASAAAEHARRRYAPDVAWAPLLARLRTAVVR